MPSPPRKPPAGARAALLCLALPLVASLSACAPLGQAPPVHSDFHVTCAHTDVTCSACHAPDAPLAKLDTACISCHQDQVPASHPANVATCSTCHDPCAWDVPEGVHPLGFDAADQHGLAANLGTDPNPDCTACHGADLAGGLTADGWAAPGCDSCHAEEGHPHWRTDCTFCHGGQAGDTQGAPPEDLDNTTNAALITFSAHQAHVAVGDHPTWGCETCHPAVVDLLDAGHLFDATPGVSEVVFTGLGAGSTWNAANGTCTNQACHGNGVTPGTATDSTQALTCDGCHGTNPAAWSRLTPLHSDHLLGDATITCADCHGAVVDAVGDVVDPELHVDGTLEVDFSDPSMTTPSGPGSCTGSCHGVDHQDGLVGHPPGYDAPDVHGLDANLQVSDCRACHGADLTGGAHAQGCDTCHATNGHPDWRTDCTFCHGGEAGDTQGAPPEDLDNTTNVALITFSAHQAHMTTADHAAYTCASCHGAVASTFSDATTDLRHWFDATAGVSEVVFTGIGASGTWNPANGRCANQYCHGNGRTNGAANDGTATLSCRACHPDRFSSADAWDRMSGEHKKHLEAGYTCSECHANVVAPNQTVTGPARHVDGTPQVSMAANNITLNPNRTCSGRCHGTGHLHPADAW